MQYVDKTYAVTNRFIPIEHRLNAVLYEPVEIDERSGIGILLMHSDESYLGFTPAMALAQRGFRVLAANVKESKKPLDDKLLDVKACVQYLRQLPGVNKLVLLGHSGGATLMSAYQSVAENGAKIFQDDHRIVKLTDPGPLPPADAVMLLDSNWGNGAMTLLSIDPAVIDEQTGKSLNADYDLFAVAHGYDPAGAAYPLEFRKAYHAAQAARSNALIDAALERLHVIEAGDGRFLDDEPLVIPGGSQIAPNNRLFPQDLHLLSHTKQAWPLLHKDGSETHEVIYSRRVPRGRKSMTGLYKQGAEKTTVRTYLTSSSVRTTPEYGMDETGIYGIDWDSSYCCTPGNVAHITVPMLIMGMTGGYEYLAAELIYHRAASRDKTIAFVEGASHNFTPAVEAETYPGEFGDTVKTCFDYVASWICEKQL